MLRGEWKGLVQCYGIAVIGGAYLGSVIYNKLADNLGWDREKFPLWLFATIFVCLLAAGATLAFWRHVKYMISML